MSSDPYKPIACGDYDIYEIAIMQQRQLKLEWTNTNGVPQKQTVTPLELKIIEGGEYLFYEMPDNKGLKTKNKIRLDKINATKII